MKSGALDAVLLDKNVSPNTLLFNKKVRPIHFCKMADRTCERCGKIFSAPSLLKRHLGRKTSCALVIEGGELSDVDLQKAFTCQHCGRRFSSSGGLRRHVRMNCKIVKTRKQSGAEGASDCLAIYRHRLEKQQVQISEQAAQLEELKMQMRSMVIREDKMKSLTANIGVINTGPVINIFGSESIDHITKAQIRSVLDKALQTSPSPAQGALAALLRTAALIYSNPQKPENITCYLPSQKDSEVMVHVESEEGPKWEIQPYELVLPPMVSRSLDALFQNQPFEGAEKYGELMIALRENEAAYQTGKEMRTILVRNKALLDKALEAMRRT